MLNSQNLEFFNQAQKLLNDDYSKRHSAEYNQWLFNHKNAWSQPHTIVPFPPFIVSAALAPFKSSIESPTEDQIVTKALELYNKAKLSAPVVAPPVVAPVAEVIEPVVEVAPVVAPVAEVIEPFVEVAPVVAEPVVAPIAEVSLPVDEQLIISETTTASVTATQYTNEIYKIYQPVTLPAPLDTQVTIAVGESVNLESSFTPIDKEFGSVPQPAEELAKVKTSGGLLPSVLQRLQDMKSKWTTEN